MPHSEPIRLPTFDFPLYFRAASPREKVACWTRNGASWAGRLTPSQYISRELHLGSQDLTASGNQKYWILTSQKSADDSEIRSDEEIAKSIYAACETYRKDAVVKDSRGERIVGHHGIASVFAHEGFRKMGLARAMFQKLTEWFDEAGECEVTTLYSDVGKDFYTRLGWPCFPSFEVVLPVKAGEPSPELPSDLSLIHDSHVPALCDDDFEELMESFAMRQLNPKKESALFAILPSAEQMQWHHARANFIGKATTGKEPEVRGARAGEGVWALWNHDFNANALVFLRVHTPPRDDGESLRPRADVVKALRAILLAAEGEAGKWGFKEVVVWNPEGELKEAWRGVGKWRDVEVTERSEDSIPALRWTPRSGEEWKVEKTVWVLNEKYAWE